MTRLAVLIAVGERLLERVLPGRVLRVLFGRVRKLRKFGAAS